MSRLPAVRPLELIKYLEERGFQTMHVRGSHHVLKLNDRQATVPLHHSEIGKGMLEEILARAGISVEEFKRDFGEQKDHSR